MNYLPVLEHLDGNELMSPESLLLQAKLVASPSVRRRRQWLESQPANAEAQFALEHEPIKASGEAWYLYVPGAAANSNIAASEIPPHSRNVLVFAGQGTIP